MPFPDEALSTGVVVGESAAWAVEGAALVDRVRQLVPDAVAVDHIGSTAVPGLAAKDCLDVMVRVRDLAAGDELVVAGYRERPEPWNREEVTDGRTFAKRVFAPAVGARSANVHVRVEGGANVRFALLFRDFLRADTEARVQWGGFKRRLADVVPGLAAYGQVKAAAYPLLMRAAEAWAVETGWDPGATAPAHPDM